MSWATKFCLICHIHLKVKLKVLARILEWEILPLSRGFAQSRDETQVSLIARGFFMVWANREAFSPTDCHFFKHLNNFIQAKIFHKQQEAENTFQEFIKSQSMDLYTTGMNKLISHWQKFVDCNGSYLINKDVFEPSYNDLKFTVWNHNYFCTKLIHLKVLHTMNYILCKS